MSLITTPRFWSSALDGSLIGCEDGLQEWILQVFFPHVEEVFLGGEFNRWSVPGLALEQVGNDTWETRLQLPSMSPASALASAGCFGFVRGRLSQVRYFRLGIIAPFKQGHGGSSFQILRHETL